MSKNCKYHPKKLAGWFCSGCDVNFCNECIPSQDDNSHNYPKCILCRRSLVSLSIAEKITPFWNKLSSLLLVPFRLNFLLVIILSSAVLALLPSDNIGLFFLSIVSVPLVEFMFNSMETQACGEEHNSNLSHSFSFKNTGTLFKLLVSSFCVVMLLTKISHWNNSLSLLLSVFFILGFPASLVILMMEKSVIAMANPVKIAFIIKLFGTAYWLVYTLLLAAAFLVFQSSSNENLNIIPGILLNIFTLYLLVCVFLTSGYLVFQYHFELNFTIDRQLFYKSETESNKDSLSEINVFIQEGRFEDAQTLLLEKIEKNPLDYKANEKLILLYGVQGKDYFLNRVAQAYFLLLIESNKGRHAADFYCDLVRRDILFLPETTAVIIAICEQMKNKDQFNIAIELIESHLKPNPMPDQWEKLYFIQASLLAELANRTHEAIILLEVIMKRSIKQELLQRAEDYMSVID